MLKGELEDLKVKYPKSALIGTINFSHDDYVKIRRRFDSIIVNQNSYNLSFSERAETIALGCILFAGMEHNDSQYWEVLADYFKKTVPQIREIVIPYLSHYFSVMRMPVYSRTRNEYVETIKMHAIIPNNKFENIVQAFYLMYIKDLRYDVSNQMVKELNRFLLELFRSNFEEEKVQDDFQGSKMSEIRQLLPSSFQKAYITNPRAVSKIVHGFLRYFDSVYRKVPYQGSLQDRFILSIEEELQSNRKNYLEVFSKRKMKTISAKVQIEEKIPENVFVIPQHFISLEDDAQKNDVWVHIYSDEKKITTAKLGVTVGGFAYRTNPKKIKIKRKTKFAKL